MITYKDASCKASVFFIEHFNIKGIAEAMETSDFYVFCGGRLNEPNIGSVTITIDKQTREINILNFPSKESTQIVRTAKELKVLEEFTSV